MGVLADITNPVGKSAISTDAREGSSVAEYLDFLSRKLPDPPYPTDYGVQNEVHSIAVYDGTVSGGTFTLTIDLKGEASFETGAITFSASAATIEAAIDTAAAGVTGWTDGDITVAGGDLNTSPVTLTFDGDSVAGKKHTLTVADGGSLTGGGSMGAITETTRGQSDRPAWATLELVGAIATAPPQGSTTPITKGTGNGSALYPNRVVLRALCEEASAEDGNPDGLLKELLDTLGLPLIRSSKD